MKNSNSIGIGRRVLVVIAGLVLSVASADGSNAEGKQENPMSVEKRLPESIPMKNLWTAGIDDVLIGEGWYRIQSTGPVLADVVHPEDAFACRLDAPISNDVVQLSCGRVRSLLANALYSPREDLALEFVGENVRLRWDDSKGLYSVATDGPIVVRVKPDYFKTRLGIKWYQPLDKTEFSRAPAGWCSWYYYYLSVDEAGILRNLDWLKANLAPFGLQAVQIDDGWQGRGDGQGDNRDWFVTCEKKFPHGMKWLADKIREEGFMPGIWLIPLTQSDGKRYEADPGLFVRDAEGKSIGEISKPQEWMERNPKVLCDWCGRYWYDASNPKTLDYLRDLFKMICRDWGYEYVKIDGQGSVSARYNQHRKQLWNPEMEGDAIYREALKAMREGMGPNRFLLNCAKGWDSCGLCQGMRIGGDVGATLEGFENAIKSTMEWLFVNNIAWWADPDVVCVRPPLSLEQARAWVTTVSITGQMFMTSDDMPALDPERVDMLKYAYPVADIRPMELYKITNRPAIFDLKVNKPGVGEWDVVAVFNWSREWTRSGSLSPKQLGIPPEENGYVFFDVWGQKMLASGEQKIELSVPPMECRVVSIRKREPRPQLIGTNRHLTQGADDIESLEWNEKSRTLSGTVYVVGGHPYRLQFTVPQGWKPEFDELEVKDGVGIIALESKKNRTMKWSVGFRK